MLKQGLCRLAKKAYNKRGECGTRARSLSPILGHGNYKNDRQRNRIRMQAKNSEYGKKYSCQEIKKSPGPINLHGHYCPKHAVTELPNKPNPTPIIIIHLLLLGGGGGGNACEVCHKIVQITEVSRLI